MTSTLVKSPKKLQEYQPGWMHEGTYNAYKEVQGMTKNQGKDKKYRPCRAYQFSHYVKRHPYDGGSKAQGQ